MGVPDSFAPDYFNIFSRLFRFSILFPPIPIRPDVDDVFTRVVIDHGNESIQSRGQEKRYVFRRVRFRRLVPLWRKPWLRDGCEYFTFDQAKTEPGETAFLQARRFGGCRYAFIQGRADRAKAEMVEADSVIAGHDMS